MIPVEIIARKRDGQQLSETALHEFLSGYTNGDIPDYQMAALLMAIYLRGMTPQETAVLTRLMRDSGHRLDLRDLPGPKVDKHSTGGVGDKVSLVLAPLVAACGVINPMISGRSLGHTGGTLDKLEAIPGFNTQLSLPAFREILEKYGTCLIGQTPEICPADKKIYALRDATATVSSLPLICGSILSKKLAEDLDALVLDVKCGSGAIFADPAASEELARALVATAAEFGLKAVAFLTQMAQPLGRAIGTWLETREAIETLQGRGPADFRELTLALSAYMVYLGGLAKSFPAALAQVTRALDDGSALRRFGDLVAAQGGDVRLVDDPTAYPAARHAVQITAPRAGFVTQCDARTLGEVSMLLGAGRAKKEDPIDYSAGILVHKKVGDRVEKGEMLAELFAGVKPIPAALAEGAAGAFDIGPHRTPPLPLILGMIDNTGRHAWPAGERQ